MRKIGRVTPGLGVVLLALGGAHAAETVALDCRFVWERSDEDRSGDVTAVFTPAGEGAWNVAFRFSGSFTDGEFTGTHGVVQEAGSLKDTGTLSLGPSS